MANEIWNVAVDGAQLPGEHPTDDVRELLGRHAGKQIRVWTPGMADWADPLTLPQFQGQPAAAAPIPSPTAPRPRPAAAAASAAAVSAAAPGPAYAPRKAAMAMSPEELQEQAGIFKALFDTSFNTLLTPKLIKGFYTLVIVILGLLLAGGILMSLVGFKDGFGTGIKAVIGGLIIFPIVALIYLVFVRMMLEVMMAIFKIKEYTGILAEKARHSE